MQKPLENYAFIDSQNLNLGVKELGWKLDFKRFYTYLRERLSVEKAYLFLGYIPKNKNLYHSLRKAGYTLIFKPVLHTNTGKIKGNCDAELVLQAMIDFKKYKRAVIITSDGDFACLVRYLLKAHISSCSVLLKVEAKGRLDYINSLRNILEYKKKKHR